MASIEAIQQSAAAPERIPAQRTLFDLMAPDLNGRWLARTARGLGWALTAYSCIPFVFLLAGSPALAQFTIKQNLAVLTWLAGLACLGVEVGIVCLLAVA